MATIEEKRKELLKMMMDAMSVTTDEAEGTQVTNIEDIHGCNTDYIDYDEPQLSPTQIANMLHLNDNNPLKNAAGFPADGYTNNAAGAPSAGRATDNTDGRNAPGTNAPSLSGDLAEGQKDPNLLLDYFDKIKITDDTQLNDVVNSIINDESIGKTRAVVEFAQPCIRDAVGVDFKFLVKPGQQIDENTIIATATINGKKKSVRSIFSKGTVLATDNGANYKRLYNGYGANRHIIIDNYTIGEFTQEFNTKTITEIQDTFRNEACVYDLVMNNLCESVLPFILTRRGSSSGSLNGREIFEKYMEVVNEIKKRFAEDMRTLSSVEMIKSTNGNTKKLKAVFDTIVARRRLFGEEIINCYNVYKHALERCAYDPQYNDCRFLAFNANPGLDETYTKIGKIDYFNYYVAIQSSLDPYQNNKYIEEYRQLLQGIIEERIAKEGYNITEIKIEFNDLFYKIIGYPKKDFNPYEELRRAMSNLKKEPTISDVSLWISSFVNKPDDEYSLYSIKQLANIYMFIHNYKSYDPKKDTYRRQSSKVNKSNADNSAIYQLVEKENEKLEKFWAKIISKFKTMTIQSCIDKTTKLIEKAQQYADWPQSTQITYKGENYDLFLFQNTDLNKKMKPDGDVDYGIDPKTDIPKVPKPLNIPNTTIDDLKFGPDNIQEGEISITDYDYWVKYFSLATVISLPFLNCGLDLPPAIMMVPLPCIFIALAAIYIKILDIVLVIGLSIRGMYIWPVFLYVNCSQMPISIMTPLISQVKNIKAKMSAKINDIGELSVQSIVDGIVQQVEEDSRELRRQNKQLEIMINQLQIKKTKNQENIKKMMNKLFKPDSKTTQQIIDPIGEINRKR